MAADIVTEVEWAANHSATVELSQQQGRLMQAVAQRVGDHASDREYQQHVDRGKAREVQQELWQILRKICPRFLTA